MKTREEREREIIVVLVKELELDISPEEQMTSAGITKLIMATKEKKWKATDFHQLGIPVRLFKFACVHFGGQIVAKLFFSRSRPSQLLFVDDASEYDSSDGYQFMA